jgi:hypothetical protein
MRFAIWAESVILNSNLTAEFAENAEKTRNQFEFLLGVLCVLRGEILVWNADGSR